MHSRIFRTTALAAAIAFSPLAMAAGAAPAQSAPSTPAATPDAAAPHRSILEELDLTTAQQSSIRGMMQQNFQQLRPQMQALTRQREAFESVTPGSRGYQSAVNDLARSEAEFAKAQTLREGAVRQKIYGLLTTAQRAKLKDLMAQRRARIAQMRQAAQAQRATDRSAPPASH